MVLAYHNILRGENSGSVIIGDIATLALVLFYWPKNPRDHLYCFAAYLDWLDSRSNLGGLCLEPIQYR